MQFTLSDAAIERLRGTIEETCGEPTTFEEARVIVNDLLLLCEMISDAIPRLTDEQKEMLGLPVQSVR